MTKPVAPCDSLHDGRTLSEAYWAYANAVENDARARDILQRFGLFDIRREEDGYYALLAHRAVLSERAKFMLPSLSQQYACSGQSVVHHKRVLAESAEYTQCLRVIADGVLLAHCMSDGWALDLFVVNRRRFRLYVNTRGFRGYGMHRLEPMSAGRLPSSAHARCMTESRWLADTITACASCDMVDNALTRNFLVFFQATEAVVCPRNRQRVLVSIALQTVGFYVLFHHNVVVIFELDAARPEEVVRQIHRRYANTHTCTYKCALSGPRGKIKDVTATLHVVSRPGDVCSLDDVRCAITEDVEPDAPLEDQAQLSDRDP